MDIDYTTNPNPIMFTREVLTHKHFLVLFLEMIIFRLFKNWLKNIWKSVHFRLLKRDA